MTTSKQQNSKQMNESRDYKSIEGVPFGAVYCILVKTLNLKVSIPFNVVMMRSTKLHTNRFYDSSQTLKVNHLSIALFITLCAMESLKNI